MVTTTTSIPIQESTTTSTTIPSDSFSVTVSPVTVSYGDICRAYSKKKKYSGSLPSCIRTSAYIKEVIYNNPATIILW